MSEITCCGFCGRDTKAADGVCSRCRNPRLFDHREEIGRKGRKVYDIPLNPVDEEQEEARSTERYHGETYRDDL